jgi:predicted dehydrogenase
MPTSIGLIGAGGVVSGYHLPVLSQLPGVAIKWVIDTDLERARALAKLYGIPRAARSIDECDDVDCVLIATPVGSRRGLVERVCARGWHAFCEKPFAATLEDHQWMVDTAARAGVRLGVGLSRRYYESTYAARRLLDSRALGPVQRIIGGEGAWLRRTGRGADWYQGSAQASGGGLFFETGSHLVDQTFTVCRVNGYEIAKCRQKYDNDLEFETSVSGTASLDGGERVPFSFVVTRLADVYNGIVVRCANGELRIPVSPNGAVEIASLEGTSIGEIGDTNKDSAAAVYSAVAGEWKEFIAALRAPAPMTDWDTGLLTTRFIEECYRLGAQSAGPHVETAQ